MARQVAVSRPPDDIVPMGMTERRAMALRLRGQRLTFREIALAMGVNTARARQLVVAAEQATRQSAHGARPWFEGLSIPTARALRSVGVQSKAQAAELVRDQVACRRDIPNFGEKRLAEVLQWLSEPRTQQRDATGGGERDDT